MSGLNIQVGELNEAIKGLRAVQKPAILMEAGRKTLPDSSAFCRNVRERYQELEGKLLEKIAEKLWTDACFFDVDMSKELIGDRWIGTEEECKKLLLMSVQRSVQEKGFPVKRMYWHCKMFIVLLDTQKILWPEDDGGFEKV